MPLNPSELPLWVLAPIGLIGAWRVVTSAWRFWHGDGALEWPEVEGVVQRSSVKKLTASRATVGPILVHDSDGGYEVVIQYAYEVGHQVHVSDRWSFTTGLVLPDEEKALKKARQYREGTKVTVHYDPADPARSVLRPGDHGGAFWGSLWGTALLVYALYGYLIR